MSSRLFGTGWQVWTSCGVPSAARALHAPRVSEFTIGLSRLGERRKVVSVAGGQCIKSSILSSEHNANIHGGNAEHNHAISMWVWILHVGRGCLVHMASAPSTSGGSSVCESDSSHVSDFTTENISTGSEAEVQSLLDRLKAPQRSELTRKRVIRKNLSSSHHGNVCKKRPCCSTNPKSVTPSSRVREFPDEHFRVSAGMLFCGACREEVL